MDQSERAIISRIEGLGDLSHASLVYSPDQRYAYIFGRDGGLTKVDITRKKIVDPGRPVRQTPSAERFPMTAGSWLFQTTSPAASGSSMPTRSTLSPIFRRDQKTIGLVDAPGRKFVFTLWDDGETWIVDLSSEEPLVTRIKDIGTNPYDALITGDGRLYITGLFGEDGLTAIDLWDPNPKPIRVLPEYGRGQQDLPVYKMPHLEGWARAGREFVLPAVGHHQVLWIDADNLSETGRTDTYGQPVFAMSRPDGRQVWVNFAHPLNDTIQVIDTVSKNIVHEFKPGKAVLHMEFTPRGHEVWVSVRDAGKVMIYDTRTFEKKGEIDAESPSGIFFTSRAHRTGL